MLTLECRSRAVAVLYGVRVPASCVLRRRAACAGGGSCTRVRAPSSTARAVHVPRAMAPQDWSTAPSSELNSELCP